MGYARPKGAWNAAFAEEVIYLRNEAGLSQRKISELSGIPLSTYTKFELDQVTLTIDQVAIIAATLSVSIENLARGARLRLEASKKLGVPIKQFRSLSAIDGLSRMLGEAVSHPEKDELPHEEDVRLEPEVTFETDPDSPELARYTTAPMILPEVAEEYRRKYEGCGDHAHGHAEDQSKTHNP